MFTITGGILLAILALWVFAFVWIYENLYENVEEFCLSSLTSVSWLGNELCSATLRVLFLASFFGGFCLLVYLVI